MSRSSTSSGRSFWPTIILIGLAELIAIVVGLALGAHAGWKRGGSLDRVGNGISLILYSMPYFVIGMPLIIIFAVELGWFPTSGMLSPGAHYASFLDQLLDFVHHLILPLATVSLGLIGGYSILMRSSIIETRSEDYVTTARAKGLTDGPSSAPTPSRTPCCPTVTVIAINLGYVVAGAITAEIVFNWPGLGTLTVDALATRDYPVLQGIFLLISIVGRSSPTSSPTSSTAGSIRGCGRERDGRPDRRPRRALAAARPQRARLRPALHVPARDGVVGLAILVVFVAPRARSRTCSSGRSRRRRRRPGHGLEAPSAAHIFGTDDLGRDMLNLTVHGARISMTIGFLATLITVLARGRDRDRRRASSAAGSTRP